MNEASVESTAAAPVVEKAVPVVEKININTGTVDEIAKLKRVGRKYAQRIIEYREKNGLFQTSEDIMKVRGIGKKTYENNKNRISVEAQVQSEKNSAGE
ncbi:MAG: ComEA family DNA-binding protein [Proteobacteria bacterium]|nr:ComEA family DNA-binding protein [Pseudomonadota bacterium]